jgi:hypothetical protein
VGAKENNMPRKQPPEGYLTSAEAAEILRCSVGMVYNYERSGQLHKKTPPGRRQGFFVQNEVQALAEGLSGFFENPIEETEIANDKLIFSRATPEDMEGVYRVAASLFGETTSAEARKPLIEVCPEGNYVVKLKEKVIAYIHIQPLKHDRLMAFMRGEIRGKHITANDLDCFAPGKKIECLVKSVGATKQIGNTDEAKRANQLRFIFKLLRGTALEMAKLGREGVEITKIYATSETVTGIAMGFSAKMEQYGKPLGTGRFRFVLDVEESNLPLLHPYKQALANWKKEQGQIKQEKTADTISQL